MKHLLSIFVLLSCVVTFSCAPEEPPASSAGVQNPNIPPGSIGPATRMVRADKVEEGPAPPADASLPEKFRTPEACFRTAFKAVMDGDVKTWGNCHHADVARIINLCIERQRALLKLPRSESSENVMKRTFSSITGKDGKSMVSISVGKTRWSKDGKAARLTVNYDIPGGKDEYRFLKTDEGWKIEGPLLIPPARQ